MQPTARLLGEPDRPALVTLLESDPGYSLFLRGNLDQYRLDNTFLRYWGLFERAERSEREGDQLRAAAMLIEHRAALYAPANVDVGPLTRALAPHGVEFTMGRDDLVDALLAVLPVPVHRREEHYLAGLTQPGAPAVRVPPFGVVRRATMDDLDALTRLYIGADGFEQLSADQVRRTMAARIRATRTYLAASSGSLVAAASTTAETDHAAMIGGVWTLPAARNRGYGTAVVAVLCRELIDEGRVPYLFYLIDNAPAAHIYAANGFHIVGRWSVAYLRGGQWD
jgi:GNAT superfamily N-acetyltransferase